MTSGPTVAECFARGFRELGVERVYGLPGEDHLDLLAALQAAGLRYVAAYQESAAVIMAATEALARGGLGVAVVSMSAGLSNAINGLAHACMEQVPLLVISGQHPASGYPFVIRQGFDLESLARPVTKWQVRVAAGMDPRRALVKAVAVATSLPRGPVYVELPADVASAPAGDGSPWSPGEMATAGTRQRAEGAGDPAISERVREAVRRARRPVLIVGGREESAPPARIAELCARLRVPALVTMNQKGAVPPESEFFAGVFLNGSVEGALLRRADCVLGLELEGFDVYSRPWRYDAPLLSVSRRPITEGFLPFRRQLIADPDRFLQDLLAAGPGRSQWTAGEVGDYRAWVRNQLRRLGGVGEGLTATRVALALERCLPRDALLAVDAGFAKPVLALLWPSPARGHFIVANALGTMGHSLPAAAALALAHPGRAVVAVMGDGSLLMRAGELQAAAAAGARPICVVLVDRAYTQIAVKQARRGQAPVGVELPEVSCRHIGAAFGCHGVDVWTEAALAGACAEALAKPVPSVIGAHLSRQPVAPVFDFVRG
jgi:acetolactate synthase-1/2/3 large subunit